MISGARAGDRAGREAGSIPETGAGAQRCNWTAARGEIERESARPPTPDTYDSCDPSSGPARGVTRPVVDDVRPVHDAIRYLLNHRDRMNYARARREDAAFAWADALMILIFAYGGFENAIVPLGEAKNPERDAPFALFVALPVDDSICNIR